ncbi:MAG: hypothetical protein ACOCP8_02500 [archaeon]
MRLQSKMYDCINKDISTLDLSFENLLDVINKAENKFFFILFDEKISDEFYMQLIIFDHVYFVDNYLYENLRQDEIIEIKNNVDKIKKEIINKSFSENSIESSNNSFLCLEDLVIDTIKTIEKENNFNKKGLINSNQQIFISTPDFNRKNRFCSDDRIFVYSVVGKNKKSLEQNYLIFDSFLTRKEKHLVATMLTILFNGKEKIKPYMIDRFNFITQIPTWKCEICNQKFISSCDLTNHYSTQHNKNLI